MRMMKHTSVNLPEEQLQAIAKTGKSPSEVIRAALDAYLNPTRSAADLVREHERLFHLPDIAHKERMDMREAAHDPRIEPEDMREPEHEMRIAMPSGLTETALIYILAELEAGREPTINDVAHHFEISVQTLAKALSPLNVRAQETKRGGKAGRYFTQAMRAQIEAILNPR